MSQEKAQFLARLKSPEAFEVIKDSLMKIITKDDPPSLLDIDVPNQLPISAFKKMAKKFYDLFESNGMTAEQAINYVEYQIKPVPNGTTFFHMLRTDMSTHLAPMSHRFDRSRHTHKFEEFK